MKNRNISLLIILFLLQLRTPSIITMPMSDATSSTEEETEEEQEVLAVPTKETNLAEEATVTEPAAGIEPTQFKTIELEKTEHITTASKEEVIKELSHIFDEAKKTHDEMVEILKILEKTRKNLQEAYQQVASDLDTFLHEINFKYGSFKKQ